MDNKLSTDHKLKTRDEIRELAGILKVKGKKIVTTNGAFDVIHSGHIKSLDIAKSKGDILIVGINSDASVRRYKSPLRPILPQDYRAQMIAALSIVDYVVIFDEDDPRELLLAIKPHVHVKSKSGYKGIEKDAVEGNGGTIFLFDDLPGISTTYILERVREIDKVENKK
jgi:rfaE bifunctional protein nucleotidyltransferase chain/domain